MPAPLAALYVQAGVPMPEPRYGPHARIRFRLLGRVRSALGVLVACAIVLLAVGGPIWIIGSLLLGRWQGVLWSVGGTLAGATLIGLLISEIMGPRPSTRCAQTVQELYERLDGFAYKEAVWPLLEIKRITFGELHPLHEAGLLRLLPLLTRRDTATTWDQRSGLHRLLMSQHPDLMLAALNAIEKVGGADALEHLRLVGLRLAMHEEQSPLAGAGTSRIAELRQAEARCRRAIEERLLGERAAKTLLRPSADPGNRLLRPAARPAPYDAVQLLRSAARPSEAPACEPEAIPVRTHTE